jgi:hypothetical protein
MLLGELLLRYQQLRLLRFATLSLLLQLPLQVTTRTLLLFKRLLQVQQSGARLDALLLQLVLQLLPGCQPLQAFFGKTVTIA